MSENTISKIKINGTIYQINDLSKITNEDFNDLVNLTSSGNQSLNDANSKLDILLEKVNSSNTNNSSSSSLNQDLFKCVSKDSETLSWIGRKATFENGQYSLSQTQTQNLTYENGLNVIPGKIYNANGTIHVDKAYNHCVCAAGFFYTSEPNFGTCKIHLNNQAFIYAYGINNNFGMYGYGRSLYFNHIGFYQISFDISNCPKLNAFTFEVWCSGSLLNTGATLNGETTFFQNLSTETTFCPGDGFLLRAHNEEDDEIWHHIAFVREQDSSIVKSYINGEYVSSANFDEILGGENNVIRFGIDRHMWRMNDFKIYDYAKYTNNFTPSKKFEIPEWEDIQTLSVTECDIDEFNGIYELVTPNATGFDRIWAKRKSSCMIKYSDLSWGFYNDKDLYYTGYEDGEPWESEWWDATDDGSGGNAPWVTLNE